MDKLKEESLQAMAVAAQASIDTGGEKKFSEVMSTDTESKKVLYYKCNYCFERFDRIEAAFSHRNVQCLEVSFSPGSGLDIVLLDDGKFCGCEYCNKTFGNDVIHQNTPGYFCDICPCSFLRPSSLDAHRRYHEPRFQECNENDCNFIAKGKSDSEIIIRMGAHRQLHGDDKPYHCEHCDEKYSQKEELRVHMGVHTFTCDRSNCDKTCKKKSDLLQHVRQVHEKIVCHVQGCELHFKNRYLLGRHKHFEHNHNESFNLDKNNSRDGASPA